MVSIMIVLVQANLVLGKKSVLSQPFHELFRITEIYLLHLLSFSVLIRKCTSRPYKVQNLTSIAADEMVTLLLELERNAVNVSLIADERCGKF